ncbi:PREDICTED: trifunctional purine biosynthetic protein adenosine-3-like [Sturnus vulgaris]|uniref:trifunctional purine biosynthetic protein adenosine-3-like n=1 Tax=Sturnus vulgaris TaxID=9172 RepID=UPI00071AA318|nr:PREDICTED: trifunctional purine biosynthetic protein adenosine-3-like [Sturnus vulgaris]
MAERVLVIGSGGREHALAWKLAQSPHVKHVFVAPGNAGTADNGKISNSAVLVSNHTIVIQFCKDHNIGLVLVGPEALLAAGIVDDLRAAGVRCFGPCARAAQLASNSSSSKAFLERHGMPTARWRAFSDPQEACRFITSDPKTCFYGLGLVIQAAIDGKLCSCMPAWSENRTAVCVVMASPGYPADSDKGMEVTGLLQAKALGLQVFHGGTALKDGRVVTSGGRVLSITAVKQDLMEALGEANRGVATIHFQGATFRRDIGHRGLQLLQQPLTLMYKDRHVGAETREVLRHLPQTSAVRGTRAGGLSEGGGFAAFFDLKASGYHDPILVSQTRGLGPKLQVAQVCKRHDTIGQELVALCVNDLLAQGAEPLFFLTHLACGKLDAEVMETIKEGIAEACRSAGCAFLGEQVTEVASPCPPGHCDLAGFVVGAVERGQRLLGLQRAQEGDVLLGLGSPSIHGRAFGVVRRILLTSSLHCSSPAPGSCGDTTLDALSWKIPEIFCWLYKEGNLSAEEMAQTFPCGIGAVLVVQKELAQHVLQDIQRQQEAWLIGKVVVPCHTAGSHIEVENLAEALQLLSSSRAEIQPQPRRRKVKVAVLVSGAGPFPLTLSLGTWQKRLTPPHCSLLSNHGVSWSESSLFLFVAQAAAISPTELFPPCGFCCVSLLQVIDHKLYGSRSEFDSTIDRVLEEFSVELICLSGFRRVLSSPFLRKWKGKILNASPSLFPHIKDGNAHQEPLESGFKVEGCTVHFVLEEPGAGAAIRREPLPGDPEAALEQRLQEAELRAFPLALQLVASGAVWLGAHGRTCWKRDGVITGENSGPRIKALQNS